MKRLLFLPVLSLLAASTFAQQHPLARDPGFVDLAVVESWFGTDPVVEVNVHGALLRMAASASRREDPELADLLSRLRAIQVRTYRANAGQRERLTARTSEFGRTLRNRGWESVVRVRDDEFVEMYLRTAGDRVDGLMVMVVGDDNEAVFINIVGQIDPDQLGRLGSRFDLGPLSARKR